MAQPVIANTTYDQSDNTARNSITVSVPSGANTGDLLVIIGAHDGSNSSGQQWQALTGWTLEFTDGDTTSDSRVGFYTREVDGTESASYSPTWADTSCRGCGLMYLITGADSSDPVDVVGTGNKVNNATVTYNSVTTTEDDTLSCAISAHDGADIIPVSSITAGWTLEDTVESDNGATSAGLTVITKDTTTTGAQGTITASATAADGWVSVQFAIAPGGGGGGGETFTPKVMIY